MTPQDATSPPLQLSNSTPIVLTNAIVGDGDGLMPTAESGAPDIRELKQDISPIATSSRMEFPFLRMSGQRFTLCTVSEFSWTARLSVSPNEVFRTNSSSLLTLSFTKRHFQRLSGPTQPRVTPNHSTGRSHAPQSIVGPWRHGSYSSSSVPQPATTASRGSTVPGSGSTHGSTSSVTYATAQTASKQESDAVPDTANDSVGNDGEVSKMDSLPDYLSEFPDTTVPSSNNNSPAHSVSNCIDIPSTEVFGWQSAIDRHLIRPKGSGFSRSAAERHTPARPVDLAEIILSRAIELEAIRRSMDEPDVVIPAYRSFFAWEPGRGQGAQDLYLPSPVLIPATVDTEIDPQKICVLLSHATPAAVNELRWLLASISPVESCTLFTQLVEDRDVRDFHIVINPSTSSNSEPWHGFEISDPWKVAWSWLGTHSALERTATAAYLAAVGLTWAPFSRSMLESSWIYNVKVRGQRRSAAVRATAGDNEEKNAQRWELDGDCSPEACKLAADLSLRGFKGFLMDVAAFWKGLSFPLQTDNEELPPSEDASSAAAARLHRIAGAYAGDMWMAGEVPIASLVKGAWDEMEWKHTWVPYCRNDMIITLPNRLETINFVLDAGSKAQKNRLFLYGYRFLPQPDGKGIVKIGITGAGLHFGAALSLMAEKDRRQKVSWLYDVGRDFVLLTKDAGMLVLASRGCNIDANLDENYARYFITGDCPFAAVPDWPRNCYTRKRQASPARISFEPCPGTRGSALFDLLTALSLHGGGLYLALTSTHSILAPSEEPAELPSYLLRDANAAPLHNRSRMSGRPMRRRQNQSSGHLSNVGGQSHNASLTSQSGGGCQSSASGPALATSAAGGNSGSNSNLSMGHRVQSGQSSLNVQQQGGQHSSSGLLYSGNVQVGSALHSGLLLNPGGNSLSSTAGGMLTSGGGSGMLPSASVASGITSGSAMLPTVGSGVFGSGGGTGSGIVTGNLLPTSSSSGAGGSGGASGPGSTATGGLGAGSGVVGMGAGLGSGGRMLNIVCGGEYIAGTIGCERLSSGIYSVCNLPLMLPESMEDQFKLDFCRFVLKPFDRVEVLDVKNTEIYNGGGGQEFDFIFLKNGKKLQFLEIHNLISTPKNLMPQNRRASLAVLNNILKNPPQTKGSG